MEVWLKGLLAAVIGGVSNSVVLLITNPQTFKLSDIGSLRDAAVGMALVSAALYLKQSPVPKDCELDEKGDV
jgi:hypothetical protein